MFLLKRDNKSVQGFYDEISLIAWIHNNHSFSFDWALEHEGYSVEEINEGAEVKFLFDGNEYEGTVESFSFNVNGIGEFNLSFMLEGQPRFIWTAAKNIV